MGKVQVVNPVELMRGMNLPLTLNYPKYGMALHREPLVHVVDSTVIWTWASTGGSRFIYMQTVGQPTTRGFWLRTGGSKPVPVDVGLDVSSKFLPDEATIGEYEKVETFRAPVLTIVTMPGVIAPVVTGN